MTVANICAQFQSLFRISAESAGLASRVALRQNCLKQVTFEPGVRLTMERRLEQTGAGEAVDSEYQGRARSFLSLMSINFLPTASSFINLYVTGGQLAGLVQAGKLLTKFIEEYKSGKELDLLKFNEGAD
tara:strand:- start:495 stop:884 length:390 start_codon:yes stop_codon:yes gene_type:complete